MRHRRSCAAHVARRTSEDDADKRKMTVCHCNLSTFLLWAKANTIFVHHIIFKTNCKTSSRSNILILFQSVYLICSFSVLPVCNISLFLYVILVAIFQYVFRCDHISQHSDLLDRPTLVLSSFFLFSVNSLSVCYEPGESTSWLHFNRIGLLVVYLIFTKYG